MNTIPTQSISAAQARILHYAAHGYTCQETADAMDVTIYTVRMQRSRLMAKIGARSMAHAVGMAYRDGGPLLTSLQGVVG